MPEDPNHTVKLREAEPRGYVDVGYEVGEAIRPFWALLIPLRSNGDGDMGHFLYDISPEQFTQEGWSLVDNIAMAGEAMMEALDRLEPRLQGDEVTFVYNARHEFGAMAMEVVALSRWYWGGSLDPKRERDALWSVIALADRADRAYRSHVERKLELDERPGEEAA